MAVLGYLPNLKKGLRIDFGAYFLHGIFMKMLLISYSIYRQSFNDIPFFPSQDIKQNV